MFDLQFLQRIPYICMQSNSLQTCTQAVITHELSSMVHCTHKWKSLVYKSVLLVVPLDQCRHSKCVCVYYQGLQMFGEDTLRATDWMAIEQAEQEAQADRMVLLSDVWLDKPSTLDHLHTVFAGES